MPLPHILAQLRALPPEAGNLPGNCITTMGIAAGGEVLAACNAAWDNAVPRATTLDKSQLVELIVEGKA